MWEFIHSVLLSFAFGSSNSTLSVRPLFRIRTFLPWGLVLTIGAFATMLVMFHVISGGSRGISLFGAVIGSAFVAWLIQFGLEMENKLESQERNSRVRKGTK